MSVECDVLRNTSTVSAKDFIIFFKVNPKNEFCTYLGLFIVAII